MYVTACCSMSLGVLLPLAKGACRVQGLWFRVCQAHLEDDGFRELLEAELVHMHMRAEGDEPQLAVLWQREQRLPGSTVAEVSSWQRLLDLISVPRSM